MGAVGKVLLAAPQCDRKAQLRRQRFDRQVFRKKIVRRKWANQRLFPA
jgi:hypothetical protein